MIKIAVDKSVIHLIVSALLCLLLLVILSEAIFRIM